MGSGAPGHGGARRRAPERVVRSSSARSRAEQALDAGVPADEGGLVRDVGVLRTGASEQLAAGQHRQHLPGDARHRRQLRAQEHPRIGDAVVPVLRRNFFARLISGLAASRGEATVASAEVTHNIGLQLPEGFDSINMARAVLGTVPVEADGGATLGLTVMPGRTRPRASSISERTMVSSSRSASG